MDYDELNVQTVKDKFPIPVVNELLDELNAAQHFTKLDLRPEYQQIQMATKDVNKTTFRVHHGDLEFMVIPFGLTNAPSTFQNMMNENFHPYLGKFVLVFSEDILIFSKTGVEHIHNVQLVFELPRTNMLFLKKSKFYFGVSQVDYLGHIVHGAGGEMDVAKI